ncbi:hypothetical protein CEP88_14380 [Roseobacter denitrificans]|uniref:Glyoxalase family protein, putative n=1 Tax=Roseobacter denitrificans (strain ATCC 33942 / OCh 114) TaxID=375451 RepID=Q16BW9_ROSDO|nr:VOC family protein [Roseobacter denitrificans]ABG30524.1 glyoxalase family protein, putative [Roseobacter denitrificans OCh 114]AVL53675.1 hypothetical protein CEP88_14380 [Roseobacter denitrificans]SFF73778.1 PhnB protein [Roseobacter denitrificans OCh 114]
MTNIKKVAPIPRGYRSLTPHITTADVQYTIDLYTAALGAEVVETETVPDSDVLVGAVVKIGNSTLSISLGTAYGAGVLSLHHYVEDIDASWDAAIATGFVPLRAIEETYWGDRSGLLVDPMGIQWSLGQRVLRLTAEERDARARAAYGIAPEVSYDAAEAEHGAQDFATAEVIPAAEPAAQGGEALH